MAAGSTYTPIATTTLGSAASSYTFSSIPSTYTDLVLVAVATVSGDSSTYIRVGNGSVDTGTNYSITNLGGSGSAASSGRLTNESALPWNRVTSNAAQTMYTFNIMNYSNSTTYKTILNRTNGTTGVEAIVGLWRSTAAINVLQIFASTGNTFNTGATFTLYGIAAA
jgi:hypothetical protein